MQHNESGGAHAPSRAIWGALAANFLGYGWRFILARWTKNPSARAPKGTREGACAPQILLLAALFLIAAVQLSLAVDNDAFSKPVSFQYLNSLDDSPATSPIVSKVVSYQYFDWPGDENVTFQYTPQVSYYFGGGVSLVLTGVVKDDSGTPIPGAEVILQRHNTVFWRGSTSANGSVPAATLPSGNFNVKVSKPGFTTLLESVPGADGGPIFLNLSLHPAMGLPVLAAVNRSPAATAKREQTPPDPAGARPLAFKIFSGTGFIENGVIDKNRMTVVISHGWNLGGGSAIAGWPTTLAYQIANQHALSGGAPNIIVWDWSALANTTAPPIDQACYQGEYLGKALQSVMGTGYNQRIHFIGHSLGTIVNAYACDYVHGSFSRNSNNPAIPWNRNLTQPHVTILDEAEIASVFGQSVITSATIGWKIAQAKGALLAGGVAAAKDWKNPVPTSAVWTDNYISLVGVQRDDAVNVCLLADAYSYNIRNPKAGLESAHAYSHKWYLNSIGASGIYPQIGFRNSYESSLMFPPTGFGKTLGSLWYENLDTTEPLDLRYVANPVPHEAQLKLLSFLSVSAGAQAGAVVGDPILNGYEAAINWVGDLGGTVIVKTGQVTASVKEKVGNGWDAALDVVSTINPEVGFIGNIVVPSLRLLLSTPTQGASLRAARSFDAAASASPPQAWVPLQGPADAAFLVFDFTVTGDPGEDQIVCAINEQNLLTLPARFAPDGSPVSTDFLDISAYAGQQVEIYFGLVGGTSSSSTLAIDGIRFVTVPTPKLTATAVGDQIRLNWPAAAAGWVLQRNPGLSPENWEDVTLPESATTNDGVVTLERPLLPTKEFFRLRRVE